MPATDSSAVQITINVVDGATGETISRVVNSLNSLGEAGTRNGQKLKQGLGEAGKAGEAVGPAVGKGMKEAGAHSLSALDNVRLLRDDLGIRIPRAMEMVIAKSSVLSGAIGAIGTGLVALGGAEIFVRLGQEAYKFYEKVSDVNAEMRKFAEEAGRNANARLFDTSSIEEVNALLRQTEATMKRLDKKRVDAGVGQDNSGSIAQYFNKYVLGGAFAQPTYNAQDDKQRADAAHNDLLLKERKRMIDGKRDIDLLEAKATEDGARLKGNAAIRAAKDNAVTLALLKEQQGYRESLYARDAVIEANRLIRAQNPGADPDELRKKGFSDVPVVASNIGEQERKDAIARATGQANAKLGRQGQDNAEETRHIVAEAGMGNSSGEDLFLQKKIEAQTQLRKKSIELGLSKVDLEARLRALDKEWYDAQTKRMLEDNARSAELEARANIGGRKGIGKLNAEEAFALQKQDDEAAAGKFPNIDSLNRNKAAISNDYNAQRSQQQGSFTERLSQLDAGRSDRYASENYRITQSAQKTVTEITKAWTEMYGALKPLDAGFADGQLAHRALVAETMKINADAARQRAETDQRLEDQTQKMEDQARRVGMPKYQQQTAAIVDEYRERYRQLEEERKKYGENDVANKQRLDRQEIAEEQIKNGKLLEQRKALADQLAGKLASLANNPLEFLKRQGEEAGSKYFADLLLSNKATGGVAAAIAGGGKGGALPSIFGSGWGGKHPATFDHGAPQAGSGTHNDNPLPATLSKPHIASDTTMLTASTATINVGTAMFNGVGTGAGKGTAGSTGGYVPLGNGGYFNLGAGGAASSASTSASPEAGAAGPSASTPSIPTDAGASSTAFDKIDKGIGIASAVGSKAKDVVGIFDEAGASAATDDAIKDAGASAQSGQAASDAGASGAGKGGQFGNLVSGGLGVYSAIEGKGGFGGALSGGLSGAKLGAQLGGPAGAIIGAVGGAILGFIGFGARQKAAEYDRKTVRPRLANDLVAYEAGQSDYQTVYDSFTSLTLEAKQQLKQYGRGATSYYDDTIAPEIKTAQQRLTREAKAGRAQVGMSAAQFHQGGFIRDFGSMSTTGDEGWIHAQRGEAVLNQQAAITHADAAMLMNAGATRSQMAELYSGGSSGSGTRVADTGSGGDVHFHVTAVDARGVQQFFDEHGHKIRAALNKSYADNSGGGDYA